MNTFDVVEARRQADHYLKQSEHHADEFYLTADRAAVRVGCPTTAAFREWARRSKLQPSKYRGRRPLFSIRDLEAELERQTRLRRKGRV